MNTSKLIFWLTLLVALLAAIYSAAGLFSLGGDGSFTFTSLHGSTVEMYGRGIYSSDSAFKAPIFRGTDAVTLFVCVPALLTVLWFDRRIRIRSRIFLTGLLAYFLYNSASLAFGAAYNNLLLVYIGCASASLFAFVLAFRSIDLAALAGQTSPKMPHGLIAAFLFVAGLSVMVWLIDIVGGLLQGVVPAHLGPYTTEATYVLDLGLILPCAYLAGILVLRRAPLGTLLASILITVNATIGVVVVSQSILQALDGIILAPAEYAIYVLPFVILSAIACGLMIAIQKNISDPVQLHR